MIAPPGVRLPPLLRAVGVDRAALDDLWRRPKVELHLHLTGTLRAGTVSELARRYEPSSPLCRPDWSDSHWSFHDLTTFIDQFRAVTRCCVRTADDYYRIARECFEDLAAQRVVYAEVSFSFRVAGRPGYVPLADTLAAIDGARRSVTATTGVNVGLLLGLSRFGADADPSARVRAERLVDEIAVARDRGAGVVGIDLDGDEQALPDVGPFVSAFRLAGEARLGRRAHAGEGAGPASVRACLDELNVSRIAHGVRSIEDARLVQRLVDDAIALDVCPTINVLLGVVPSIAKHPALALQRAGVAVGVSSDVPTVCATTVTSELAVLQRFGGWTRSELGATMVAAAGSAFLPETERARLVAQVQAGWS